MKDRGRNPVVSRCVPIVLMAAFQVPADVPSPLADRIRELAISTFRVLCCEGMARIDFFLSGEQIFVNEANTLPGFTNISMYPLAFKASGVSNAELVDRLIKHALARAGRAASG